MPSAPCSRLEELHTSLVDAVDGVVPLFLVLGDEVVEETGADNVMWTIVHDEYKRLMPLDLLASSGARG